MLLGLDQVNHLRAIVLPNFDLDVGFNPRLRISEFINDYQGEHQSVLCIHSCFTIQPFPMSMAVEDLCIHHSTD